MPTSVGPNTFGEENLVFGYDTGDTANSYKGEPTVNLATLDLGNTSVWYNEDAATTTKELQSETLFGYPVYKFASRPGSIWITPFAFNGYDKANGPITVSAYIRNMGAVATVSTYLSGDYSTDSLGSSNYKNIPTDGVWRRYSWTRTAADMNTANQLEFRTSGDNMQISCPQVGHKLHPTPIVEGTRSATQGLVDLTGNSTIDLTNVSFDSNAQMTFDGTDDKAVVANFPHIWDGSVSLETVVSWNDNTRSIIFGNYNVGANDINFEKLTTGNLRFYWNRGERDITTGNNVVTTSGAYHHVVFIRDKGSNSFKFYVDGEVVGTTSNVGTDVTSTGSTFRIGGDSRNGDTIHNGDIPLLKIYNRALTASEIKANYNAIKGRFNI